jgi:hypothetical protein
LSLIFQQTISILKNKEKEKSKIITVNSSDSNLNSNTIGLHLSRPCELAYKQDLDFKYTLETTTTRSLSVLCQAQQNNYDTVSHRKNKKAFLH